MIKPSKMDNVKKNYFEIKLIYHVVILYCATCHDLKPFIIYDIYLILYHKLEDKKNQRLHFFKEQKCWHVPTHHLLLVLNKLVIW
jgi:hypothetical protein